MDLQFDQQHVWHPYAALPAAVPPWPVAGASGVRIALEDGRQLIDGMSSWWAAIHGYNHPRLNQALTDQAQRFSHVMFGGLTHEPAIELCRKLVELTPAGLEKVFLSDSGSVSVEVAMKLAVQYWRSRGDKKRSRFLTVRNGYHGDTFAAMSVCDPVNGMHSLFRGALTEQLFADAPMVRPDQPWDRADLNSMRGLAQAHRNEIAAVILEPVVQGAGGMRFYHPQYLVELREMCDQLGLLLIFDEIATGFGRSGKLFAAEHAGVSPDIICLGKALTGGMMTLAATLTTDAIASTICSADPGLFMHGPTFMANPLACAVANTSIELLLEQDWEKEVLRLEDGLKRGLLSAGGFAQVADVRVMGAIGVVELHEPVDMRIFQPALVEAGVWVRPFGKLVYLMPPYIISNADLDTLTCAVLSVIAEYA